MFNSNLSLTVPPLLGIDGGVCTTPRTPEILNSLMAMTNPLEYSYPVAAAVATNGSSNNTTTTTTCSNNPASQTSHDSHSNSSDSPLDSPAGPCRTPSVQQTRSQLIKAGVKLLIQSKRKHSGCDSSDDNESSSCGGGGGGSERGRRSNGGPKQKMRHDTDLQTSEDDVENHRTTSGCSSTGGTGRTGSPRTGLTPEDEDRRRRRRERNKIAATKCRMKKRERTVNLVNESETLDAQNKELKSQVSELENQRRKLMEVLQAHSPTCVHQKGYQPLPSLSTITNNNCKFLNDLNFLDNSGEIKYSECLKSGSELGEYSKQDNTLPPGYCKLSPTEVNYGTPTDVMDVNSYANQSLKSEYIPNGQERTRSKPGPKPRQRSGATVKRTVTVSTTTTVTETLPPAPVTLPSADFILKNELIDTSSPYTTIQSADRFLFENSMDLFNNNNNDSNTLDGHHTNDSDKLTSLAVKDNASNALLEFSANFDTAILKPSEYAMLTTNQPQQHQQLQQQQQHHQQQHQQQQQCHLQQNLGLLLPHQQTLHNPHQFLSHSSLGGAIVTNDFLILPEHDGGEFTDLDSGITSYANINGSCLA
ncbi:activating transcription factor 3 [Topomyia yanbarensis]|uniref:activating transcription factor 3 n=1 Tax=Topomyia yanbarensis TaxID=2498891 RepID=UPI00273ADF67|nr:activating transcription factor 3 [Topomyia yanbarensis]XP_058825537.1 activating transcription factor 3 [Topomyia yanbarensis]